MSTLAILKTSVKGFIYNNSNYTDRFQGGTSAVNLEAQIDAAILVAANNARLWAERNHDFAFTKVRVPAVMVPAGLDLNALGSGPTRIKKVEGVDIVLATGGKKPMLVTTMKDFKIKQRIQDRLVVEDRYPGTIPSQWTLEPRYVVDGLTLNTEPVLSTGESTNIEVRGYKWLNAYTAMDGTTDWLIQNGQDFLMWQSIIELNYIVQIFVPRQEGSLSPPEKQRDEAWSGLKIVDEDISGGLYDE